MDFFKLLAEIERLDPEAGARFDTRRRVFRHAAGLGRRLSAAALPGVVSLLFGKAYGQSSTTLPGGVADVLNLALQLEYLEYYFYHTALNTSGLLASADVPAITSIRNDESGHIKVLRAALGSQVFSQSVPTAADFDFTAGGRFANVFSDAAVFYAVAQSFEDLGVRAYKGGATKLLLNKDVLETALNIHSVEARHSSHLRTLRRGLSAGASGAGAAQVLPDTAALASKPKNWISGDDAGGAAAPFTAPIYGAGNPSAGIATQIFYPGEGNLIQVGVDVQTSTAAPSGTNLTMDNYTASESFDEALNEAAVKDIALFFRSAQGARLGLFQ